MRPDMAKVVTERPRYGSDARSAKTGGKIDPSLVGYDYDVDDSGPMRTKASRRGQCRGSRASVGGDCHKQFSDLLSPLLRYLRKQVGRDWDAIYSELSATLDKRSLTGIHIWDHIKAEVSTQCYLGVSGRVFYGGARRFFVYGGVVTGLYVHPVTHRLCYTPKKRFHYQKPVDPNLAKFDDLYAMRFKGVWYAVTHGKVEHYVDPRRRKDGTVIREGFFKDEEIVISKRQLSRKELRLHGLVNAPDRKIISAHPLTWR